MADLFCADLHFGHKNSLAFDNRPFTNVEDHDNAIIGNWNSKVDIADHVYVLGDCSYHNVTKTIDIFNQLNGMKTLVVGNHCAKFLKNKHFRDLFVETTYYKELDISDGKKLILCHYPIVAFNGQFRGNIHLYGHVHNSPQWNMVEHIRRIQEEERGVGTCRMYNCGIMLDYMGFVPRTLEEILEACEGEGSENVLERNLRSSNR